jgi:sugar phosphate isomerase/epimerase
LRLPGRAGCGGPKRQEEEAVFVACSTQCFGRYSLEEALRQIGALEFGKFDLTLHERGKHLKPSEVADDVNHAAARLRLGPGLVPCAFSVEIEAPSDEEYDRQFRAVCRLARISAVPLVTLTAAPVTSGLDDEAARLTRLTHLADAEGILLNVATITGTLTETSSGAIHLCELVEGLGLTLDPSHFLVGPHQGKPYDEVFPYVRHVHLRDSGRSAEQFQVRVGQGEIEYGRIIAQLARLNYERTLTVDVRDIPDAPFAMEPEVRKLKYLLESLV